MIARFNGGAFHVRPEFQAEAQKFKSGVDYRIQVTRPGKRNLLHHKKFFSLLKYAWENSDYEQMMTFEVFRRDVIRRAGFYDEIRTLNGNTEYRAKSISFARMKQDEFEELYLKYESENKGRKTIKARELWEKILESQIETGTPYMLYKDSANRKSNQKNLGTIRSSNLCTEIMEYTSPDEVAVCNLASIALPMFVKNGEFDHKELYKITKQVIRNLNKVIDRLNTISVVCFCRS